MVVILCHLVWVCYIATVNHDNCFKAIERLERFESPFHQKAIWLQWAGIGDKETQGTSETIGHILYDASLNTGVEGCLQGTD